MRYPNICFWNPILPDMTCTLLAPIDWHGGRYIRIIIVLHQNIKNTNLALGGIVIVLMETSTTWPSSFGAHFVRTKAIFVYVYKHCFWCIFAYFWTPNTPFCPHFVKRFDMFFLRPSSPQLLACVVLEFRCKHSYSRGKSYSENLLNHTN